MPSRKTYTVSALIDLTRVAYFGPAVAALFLLGGVLAMPNVPDWSALSRIVVGGVLGFLGGFVLNDWADRSADRVMLSTRAHDGIYQRQLRRERPFTRTRPIAEGIISANAALACALGLIALSALIAVTFPSPHRWYLLAALSFNSVAEPLYCYIKSVQSKVPIATFFHGILLGICPAAGYLALRPPDLTTLALFLSTYLWEVGFNQLYDMVDIKNDRQRGLTTLSTLFGLPFVARWCFALSMATAASFLFVWRASHFGLVMLVSVCIGGALLLVTDAILLLRPRLRVASSAITIHQVYFMLLVGGAFANAALVWSRGH